MNIVLPQIRALIMGGKIKEAQELCALALSGIPEEQRNYEPLGNLYIEFDGTEQKGAAPLKLCVFFWKHRHYRICLTIIHRFRLMAISG